MKSEPHVVGECGFKYKATGFYSQRYAVVLPKQINKLLLPNSPRRVWNASKPTAGEHLPPQLVSESFLNASKPTAWMLRVIVCTGRESAKHYRAHVL